MKRLNALIPAILSAFVPFIFTAQAVAKPSLSLESIITAKTAQDLAAASAAARNHDRLRLVCLSQLRGSRIPAACFHVLDAGSSAGLNEKVWLTSLCKRRAAKSADWKELATAAKDTIVPVECRKVADERAADMKYSAENESPAQLFGRSDTR